LVASAPLLANPIALAFDEDGRLFVVETPEPGIPGADQAGGLRMLEDTASNGVFDASTQYADKLASPRALVCYAGGVYVACADGITYLKDSRHNGVADTRQDVFKTFSAQGDNSAGKVIITSLAWGLDNRIHAGAANGAGDVISSSSPVQSMILGEGNFSFDPRSLLLSAESGTADSGMSFDNRGREFVCSPAQHIGMVVFNHAYAARNPFYEMPDPVVDLAGNGPASRLYPAGSGSRPAPSPVRFTEAAGITIYRGNAFPPEYLNNAFTIDSAANVLHRDQLRQQGVELTAEKPASEAGTEFLAVRDRSLHLNCVVNGPEGALYLGVASPSGGRIYRITPASFKEPLPSQLSHATGDQLVALLRHPNGWQRETAARLLYERQDKNTVTPLIRLLYDPGSPPLARMHALQVLDGLQFAAQGHPVKALAAQHVLKALFDPDDRVREHAVLLAERFLNNGGMASDQIWGQLCAMTGDISPPVRYQLAFTLGQSRQAGRVQALAAVIQGDLGSRWMQSAVLSSLSEGAAEMLDLLAADASVRSTDAGQTFLLQLAGIVGAKDQPAEAALTMRDLGQIPDSQLAFNLARMFDNGLERANSSLAAADTGGMLRALFARATRVALDDTAPDTARIPALQLLSATDSADPALAAGLIAGWPARSTRFRSEAVAALLARAGRTPFLLNALGNGIVPRSDLTSTQLRFLLGYPDPSLRQQAANILSAGSRAQRQAVVNQFLPASQAEGQADRGRQVYLARCAQCHQFAGQGNAGGLDLDVTPRSAKQSLLIKVLDPNRFPSAKYVETLVETKDGELVTGFVTGQTATSASLCDDVGAERVVAHARIQYQGSLGFSAMPDGLEAGLTLRDMADLLEYLTTPTE
jgi:putative membrane-bound dehydrogenase-like protein